MDNTSVIEKTNDELIEAAIQYSKDTLDYPEVTCKLFYIEVCNNAAYSPSEYTNIGFFRTTDEAETRILEYMLKKRDTSWFGLHTKDASNYRYRVCSETVELIPQGKCIVDSKYQVQFNLNGGAYWFEER